MMVKSLVYDCIFEATGLAGEKKKLDPNQSVKKSVYSSEPLVVEHEILVRKGAIHKMYAGPTGSAIFVADE